jgi:hypothetical protein
MAKARKKLAAESWTYVPESDRKLPTAEQSRFILRPLTMIERKRVWDEMSYTDMLVDGSTRAGTRSRQVAYHHLISHVESIENFPVGAPRPWPKDRDARVAYVEELLDDALADEIGSEIIRRSVLQHDEEVTVKNSSAPAPTSGSGDASLAGAATA